MRTSWDAGDPPTARIELVTVVDGDAVAGLLVDALVVAAVDAGAHRVVTRVADPAFVEAGFAMDEGAGELTYSTLLIAPS